RVHVDPLNVGAQQSVRAEHPSHWSNDDLLHPHRPGNSRSVQCPRSSEDKQRELSRISASLRRHRGNGPPNIGIRYRVHSMSGLDNAAPQATRHLLLINARRLLRVERKVTAQKVIWIHIPENDVGISQRRLLPTLVIANGSRGGPSALRADI